MLGECKDDTDLQFRVPWSTICKLACAAMINHTTLDEVVEVAIKNALGIGMEAGR